MPMPMRRNVIDTRQDLAILASPALKTLHGRALDFGLREFAERIQIEQRRRRAGKCPTLTALYDELGVPQRNNRWGWSGCSEATNTVVFQIDMAHLRQPNESERREGVELVHEMTSDDVKAWRDLCISRGRQAPEKQLGWRMMREDLSFALTLDSCARAIVFDRETDDKDDDSRECTNWRVLPHIGKVVAYDESRWTYKITFFKS